MKLLEADFPHEFRGKPKIQALCRILDEEMEQIEQAAEQVGLILCIDTSQGKQLDMIGEIVVLSRMDAVLLAKQGGSDDFEQMDDARYRKYLKYKILANTSHCTYYDIITAVKTIWDVDKVSYNENADGPASLTISFPYAYDKDNVFIIPPLTAAGVGINVKAESKIERECSLHAAAFGQTILKGTISQRSVVGADFSCGVKMVPLSSVGICCNIKERTDKTQ